MAYFLLLVNIVQNQLPWCRKANIHYKSTWTKPFYQTNFCCLTDRNLEKNSRKSN